jgi:ubiquinone/menaquinone biosynthesis C-methylase UbiE
VYPATGPLPFTAEYFDLVLSDFVLEHVEQPEPFLREVNRVLKPGCSFFFRTPNRNHYIAMAARATPHWFHEMVANRARSMSAEAHEPWPAYYRLNSRTQIRRAAIASGFTEIEFRMYEAEPSYLVFHEAAFAIGTAYERLVNRFDFLSGIRANIFGRLKK